MSAGLYSYGLLLLSQTFTKSLHLIKTTLSHTDVIKTYHTIWHIINTSVKVKQQYSIYSVSATENNVISVL